MREITNGDHEFGKVGRPESTEYEWDRLFNGSQWEIDVAEEYEGRVTVASFARAARRAAQRRGIEVGVSVRGPFVILQAKPD